MPSIPLHPYIPSVNLVLNRRLLWLFSLLGHRGKGTGEPLAHCFAFELMITPSLSFLCASAPLREIFSCPLNPSAQAFVAGSIFTNSGQPLGAARGISAFPYLLFSERANAVNFTRVSLPFTPWIRGSPKRAFSARSERLTRPKALFAERMKSLSDFFTEDFIWI